MPEYDGYNRDRDRYNDQGEGLIQRYERLRYNGIRPVFSDEGKYIPLEQHFKEESELYARFGSNSALSDVKNLSQVEKLVKAVEASGNYLEDEIVEELRAIFTPATLATMVGVFAVYVAAHATGVGQAADILMLLAGGIFFGLDTISIFKDIAGFANAMSATSQEDLDKAGQHLANLVATVSVDVVMTLLTSKVADKISSGINKTSGVEKPGTTTGDMDNINRSIRRHNAPEGERYLYNLDDVGNEISKSPLARKAYQRINDQGSTVYLDHDMPSPSNVDGEFRPAQNNVHIYEANNMTPQDVVGTMVHESTHVDYRYRRRIKYNTQYEEYRAAVRERMYRRSLNPEIEQIRPPLRERRRIWQDVAENYSNLDEGKNPFGGSR